LRRSLQSGDEARLEAAISLAEDGGAGERVLADARERLRSVATASLVRARHGGDAVVLSAAIDRADELCVDVGELQEAREELLRLAHSGLRSALSGAEIADLEEALRIATLAGASDAALVANAQRRLRELLEPIVAAAASEQCVLNVAGGADGPEDEDRRAAEKGLFLKAPSRRGKTGPERDQANLVAPTVIGRQDKDAGEAFMMEAGLRRQPLHRVVPSTPQRSGLRKQGAAHHANEQECTLQ